MSDDEELDPIIDIIDYLVRCVNINVKNEKNLRTRDKVRIAHDLYKESPVDFLSRYGKHLAPQHLQYFENLPVPDTSNVSYYKECIKQLKEYHSEENKHKRVRNRRYKALKKMIDEADYFSEKEMMYRNPALYHQLVGQYLTDEEIRQRDGADSDNLTLLNMILETVDRNQMRERMSQEDSDQIESTDNISSEKEVPVKTKSWGEFDEPEPEHSSKKPIPRKQMFITENEKRLLHEEFRQEMYSSFIDGRDEDMDYSTIDNNELYDDLEQATQDAEDKYFDSEPVEAEHLETHMDLVEQYGNKIKQDNAEDDTLVVYMEHLNKINNNQ